MGTWNLGLVILDRRWYVAECRRQLADTATYQQVPASDVPLLVPGLQQRLAATVWRHALALPGQVQRFLTATAHTHTRLPSFYLLPKIHKLPQVTPQHLPLLRGRPIVAAHSWITTPTSQWLAQVLNAACAQAHPHVLPDSRALIVQLESTHVASGSILVTFDVESMYPSIDTSKAIPACVAAAPQRLRAVVRALLTLVMAGSYLTFQGRVFRQVQGGAMGTPCMPPVANIHMAHWVEAPVRARSAYWPRIFRRFIDDGFFVWERDAASLDAFLAALNTALPGIRLTWHTSTDSIAFMDLVISKGPSLNGASVSLQVSTFQKAHNKYLYVPRGSFHRPHMFTAFVRGELIRYAVTNTHSSGFDRMKALFRERLLDRGYSDASLDPIFASVSHTSRHEHLHTSRRQRGSQGAA